MDRNMDTEMMTRTNESAGIPATVPESSGFIMRGDGTTFIIGLHFSETSKDTLEDKVKKLIRKDVESDNF